MSDLEGATLLAKAQLALRQSEARCLKSEEQLHELQSQLAVSDRMASVGMLAAGVAHELNNPLAVVIANLDSITESLGHSDEDISRASLREMIHAPIDDAREAAEQMRFVVRDLKLFSRSSDGDERGLVDVAAIMESSVRMAGNELRHRANLIKHYGAVPRVDANAAKLSQVFTNLIANAAQAFPDCRSQSDEIRVSTRLDGDQVVVEVSDTGPGIPPEILGSVFDAFFTTKASGGGTGLGLAICRRIVTEMGGALTVESEVGKGTTFRVALPAAGNALTAG